LDITVFRDGKNIDFWGRSSEISVDGVGGTLTGLLEPGEVVWLVLTLPNPVRGIKLRALVRYRDGLRHGFEFLGRDAKQREALEQFCEQLSRNN
jgi:PilZ domain